MRFLPISLGLLVLGSLPAQAFLYDEFEVFAPPSGEAGALEVDQHVNYGLRGRLRPDEGRALPTQGGIFLNTEISYGLLPWYTLTLELPAAITSDGRFHDGGFKLRNLFALGATTEWSFGVLAEVQHQPRGFLPQPWGFTLSPLVAWNRGHWSVVLNSVFGVAVGSRGSQSVFAPAARVAYAATDRITVGLEYYGDFGRIERWEPVARQGQQVLGVAMFDLGGIGLRLGIGRGLTPATERWVGTAVLSFEF